MFTPEAFEERSRQVLYDQKWKKFLRRAGIFRYLPFVDFVLAAGSMATGEVHRDSDFDVILGVRQGRIFTARFIAVALLDAFRWRRKKLSHHEAARDMICLNHFVTERAYRLSPPHNDYWINLYRHLIPIYGDKRKIRQFFHINGDWIGAFPENLDDLRYKDREPSIFQRTIEFLLRSAFGDKTEIFLKKIQITKIKRSLSKYPPGYKPRIKYGDDELEFHPDTKRIEEFSENPLKNN